MPFPEKEREVLLSFMNALLESCENLLLASVTLGNGSFGVCHSQGELPLLDTCQTCLGAPWDPCALHCKAGEAQTAQMQYSYSGQFGFFVEMLAPRAGAPFTLRHIPSHHGTFFSVLCPCMCYNSLFIFPLICGGQGE